MKFVLLAAAAPVLWMAYNAIVYKNPLEFANGPYSAKAIEQKTATVNPAKGNLLAAGSVFSESRGTGRRRSKMAGPAVAGAGAAGQSGRGVRRTWTPRIAAVGASAVLRLIHRVRQRADFCAAVVAIFPIQPALWTAASARLCRVCALGDCLPRPIGGEASAL